MPGPFPDTTVEAVGTCLRTLAQQPDADAPLASATAATLSGLRAFADRLALRRRFHDASSHSEHRPQDAHASALFDLLELARLDAIGAGSSASDGISSRIPGSTTTGCGGSRSNAGAANQRRPRRRRLPPRSRADCPPRSRRGWAISRRFETTRSPLPPRRRPGPGTRPRTSRPPRPPATAPARCSCRAAMSGFVSSRNAAIRAARRHHSARIDNAVIRQGRRARAPRSRPRPTVADTMPTPLPSIAWSTRSRWPTAPN